MWAAVAASHGGSGNASEHAKPGEIFIQLPLQATKCAGK